MRAARAGPAPRGSRGDDPEEGRRAAAPRATAPAAAPGAPTGPGVQSQPRVDPAGHRRSGSRISRGSVDAADNARVVEAVRHPRPLPTADSSSRPASERNVRGDPEKIQHEPHDKGGKGAGEPVHASESGDEAGALARLRLPRSADSGDDATPREPPSPTVPRRPPCLSARSALILRVAIALAIVGVLTFVLIETTSGDGFSNAVEGFTAWVKDAGAVGPVVYAVVYIFGTLFFVPGTILTLAGGFAFAQAFGQGVGIAVCSVATFIAASTSACGGFLIARHVFREWASALAHKYRIVRALDGAFRQDGLRIVSLLRLSPVVPFGAFNYVAGSTALAFRDYAIACFAMIPGTVAYSYFGSILSDAKNAAEGKTDGNPTVQWIVLSVGICTTIACLVLITRYVRLQLTAATNADAAAATATAAAAATAAVAAASSSTNAASSSTADTPSGTAGVVDSPVPNAPADTPRDDTRLVVVVRANPLQQDGRGSGSRPSRPMLELT